MNEQDLAFTPATEQAQLIRSGAIAPLELTELYLKRIEALNPKLGSYFTVFAEQAIATARSQTEALSKSTAEELPPFFGVPIAIKDLNPVANTPCSYGLKAAKNRIASEDDLVVARLRQAGFIFLGKTATSQMGSLPYTEPPGFPPARNPWHLDYTPGGSSGGAAAAVAAGLTPIAQGSDGGGSIRGPAFCCGLVGLKPSRGRISSAPAGERLNGLATEGPLAHTVKDAAALLDVLAGYVPGDPYWLPQPATSFVAASQRSPGSLRIGFATTLPPIGQAAKPCRQAVETTAKRLEALGHHVEAVDFPDLSALIEPFTILWQGVFAKVDVPFFILERFNRWLRGRARRLSGGAYLRAIDQLHIAARPIVEFCESYDVILLPTYLQPPLQVGQFSKLRAAKILEQVIDWIAPCPPFNATGQPAIALPVALTEAGLPIGVQLVGNLAQEECLISLAAQLEQAHPWHYRPELFDFRQTVACLRRNCRQGDGYG